ncbi:hypothetical protein DPMN_094853 [Dreissena polymorpha]|uniref:Uncharacterized protein n=1 Tax=Dreissena polymorpha TaxID=45954 RepID=A0A9D4R379_DREPO|nr:hypothetical protein DPMN_094853 [Dreissena polymorpha]
MNLLTKFHEHRTVNVASRVLTRFYYSRIGKNAPPLRSHEKCPAPGGHVFKATKNLFELFQDIIVTNLQTEFHDDRKINVTSKKFTYRSSLRLYPIGHAFLPIRTIFELNQCSLADIFFSPICTIFELVRDINETNVLTKFHDDWAKIETSRVFTRNTAPPPGGHVFSTVFTSINGTNVLTKFHEDRTINVASSVHKANVDGTQRTTDKRRSQKPTMRMLCSGELKTGKSFV